MKLLDKNKKTQHVKNLDITGTVMSPNALANGFRDLPYIKEADVIKDAVHIRFSGLFDGSHAVADPRNGYVSWKLYRRGVPQATGKHPLTTDDSQTVARSVGCACMKALANLSPTCRLLWPVLREESPELFDGSQNMPLCVVSYEYSPFVEAVCDTCGDDSEMLTVEYLTHGGEVQSKTYWDFGLPRLLETAEKWSGYAE